VSPARLSPHGRTRVAKPSPVPSSGFLPLSTVLAAFAARVGPLRGPSLSVTPRRFAALFHAARAPGSRPAELSLPGEPYPLSRASCFLAGSWSTAADATHSGFRGRFPHRVDSLPSVRLGLAVTAESGRWFPAVAETGPTSCTRHGARPIAPSRVVTRRLTRPSRPLRSFAPPGSPFASFRHLGQVTEEGRCSRGRVPL